jgi:integrase
MSKLYNEEIKERFLSQYDNEQTQKTIRNVFLNSHSEEDRLSKDLYDFDQHQISLVIKDANPHSKSVAKSLGRFIRQYIEWAISVGLRVSNLNPVDVIPDSQYDTFIDKTKKIHYSYDEFLSLLEDKNFMNGQDQAFLFLIFEGIMGQKFSQLRELKFSDINWDNKTVYVKERNEHIPVTDDCIKYLQKAYEQSTYYQFNSKTKDFNEKILLNSPFIFKNVVSPRSTEGQQVGMNVLYSRLHALKEILELEYLTPNAIKQSGMIKMAVDIYNEEGILAYDQLAKIGEKYDYSKLINNGYEYYNTYLMREFVNETNIKDLYDIDLEIKLR